MLYPKQTNKTASKTGKKNRLKQPKYGDIIYISGCRYQKFYEEISTMFYRYFWGATKDLQTYFIRKDKIYSSKGDKIYFYIIDPSSLKTIKSIDVNTIEWYRELSSRETARMRDRLGNSFFQYDYF